MTKKEIEETYNPLGGGIIRIGDIADLHILAKKVDQPFQEILNHIISQGLQSNHLWKIVKRERTIASVLPYYEYPAETTTTLDKRFLTERAAQIFITNYLTYYGDEEDKYTPQPYLAEPE